MEGAFFKWTSPKDFSRQKLYINRYCFLIRMHCLVYHDLSRTTNCSLLSRVKKVEQVPFRSHWCGTSHQISWSSPGKSFQMKGKIIIIVWSYFVWARKVERKTWNKTYTQPFYFVLLVQWKCGLLWSNVLRSKVPILDGLVQSLAPKRNMALRQCFSSQKSFLQNNLFVD